MGRHIIDQPTSLRLPVQASRQGPPPSGGDSPRGLRGAVLRSRRAASGPRHTPWGCLPSQLTDEVMQEGGEDGWRGPSRLGLDCVYWLLEMD